MNLRAKVLGACLALSLAAPASARPKQKTPNDAAGQTISAEAQERFQRGVELYQEGNVDAARAELQRAYETAPTYKLLYDLGQVNYELHDYPAALIAFEKYLSEGGAKVSDARRTEVEGDIEKLRARVARIELSCDVSRARVFVDDVSVGSTPLGNPIVVSAGRRKITVSKSGYLPVTRWVDLAGGDSSELEVDLTEIATHASPQRAPAAASNVERPAPLSAAPDADRTAGPLWGGWALAGSFAVGAGVMGTLAYFSSRSLAAERSRFGASREELDSRATKVRNLAVAADVCGGASIATAAVTLFLSLTRGSASRERGAALGEHPSTQIVAEPGSVRVTGRF